MTTSNQINISGNAIAYIAQLGETVTKTASRFEKFSDRAGQFNNIVSTFDYINTAVNAVGDAVAKCTAAYEAQAVVGTRLSAVMQQKMGAGTAEIESIKQLTNAQQKLGVISSSIQTAGAQELATYVDKTDSIKQLIPAINNMAAQQYGLNTTQENYAQLAASVGKVMQGQVAVWLLIYRSTGKNITIWQRGTAGSSSCRCDK